MPKNPVAISAGPLTSVPSASTNAAPPKLPIDQQPWNRLMIGLPRACSTCTASAFIDTSKAPWLMPTKTPPTIST
ncbi:MAG: hypothetical protein CR980_01735, partial [Propionibacteriales bacterium]